MSDTIIHLFNMEIFRNAALAGLFLSLAFGLLSFFIVTRRLSFMGAGIAHTAFGGVAAGVALGIDPFITALIFCTASAVIISRTAAAGNIGHDTAIGIFFSFSMALGAIIISLGKGYSFDLMGYLFGNILSVNGRDIIFTALLLAAVVPPAFIFFNRLMFAAFDPEAAKAAGIPTALMDTVLLAYLSAAIVVSMKVAGIILVTALAVLPASFGLLVAKRIRPALAMGIIYSVIIIEGGLILSFLADTPPGATMVVLGTAVYFAVLAAKKVLGRNQPRGLD